MKNNFVFDHTNHFNKNGKAKVQLGEHLGEINTKGELVTEIKYEELERINDNFFIARVDNKTGVIDNQENVIIPFQYAVLRKFTDDSLIARLNRKFGVISAKGNVIVDFKYDRLRNSGKYLCAKIKDKWGLLNSNGETILPFEYQDNYFGLIWIYNDIAILTRNNKWGAVNLKNEVVIPFEYKSLDVLSNETFYAERENGKWIVIDYSNKQVCKIEFDSINENMLSAPKGPSLPLKQGLFPASIDGEYGFIDKFGNVKIEFQYEDARPFEDGFAAVSEDGEHWGLIDQNDNLIIPFEYSSDVFRKHEDVICAEKNGKYGLIDWNNNVVVDFIYGWIGYFNEGFAPADLDGKWGFIDKQGKALEIKDIASVSE